MTPAWGAAPPDPATAAVETVKKSAPGCEACHFFALKTQSALVKNHAIFFVSTLDRVPPPLFSVAVPKKGDPLLLDARNLPGWNRLIAAENLKLSTNAEIEAYVKAFLDLAVGRALFLPALLPAELERVRKKNPGAPKTALTILKEKGVSSVSFYARDVTGALQLWDLVLEASGIVVKSDVQTY